jgi:hypothetical protein
MPNRDGLKSVDKILVPDSRNLRRGIIDPVTGEQRLVNFEDHHRFIEQYSLGSYVPDNVATQYDVARNLYVYAWYEYRFLNVAENKALTVLEFALRARFNKDK